MDITIVEKVAQLNMLTIDAFVLLMVILPDPYQLVTCKLYDKSHCRKFQFPTVARKSGHFMC